ncbi:hypothetical protein Btru_002150 [Bulinus truncatus]|nr:hypothetical protein Btru_002150 [Bulinus truncatus]
MPHNYHQVMSPYYCDTPYSSSNCSPAPLIHSPGSSSSSPFHCPEQRHPVSIGYGLEEESDVQPLDLSVKARIHEPVAKKPRLDYDPQDNRHFPKTCSSFESSRLKHRASPYSQHLPGLSRSPNHASSPSFPSESTYYAQGHNRTPSPGFYYMGQFPPGAYHVPNSSSTVFSTSAPSFTLVPSEGIHSAASDVHRLGRFVGDHERPKIQDDNNICYVRDLEYHLVDREEKQSVIDGTGCIKKNLHPKHNKAYFHELHPVKEEIKLKEESELSRLLASSRPTEVKSFPNFDNRSITPSTNSIKTAATEVKVEQSPKALFQTKDIPQAVLVGSSNQAPLSSVKMTVKKSVSPPVQPSPAITPSVSSAQVNAGGNTSPDNRHSASKIKSKKSLLLSRTAGLFHTVSEDTTGAQPKEKDAPAVPAQSDDKNVDSTKISLLDFWISKILMERSEETPKKPCSVDYIRRTGDGQKRIRISLVDLIELQEKTITIPKVIRNQFLNVP